MTLNVENIQKTIDLMRLHAGAVAKVGASIGFDMGWYVHKGDCGTTCCLAGFAQVAEHGDTPHNNGYVHDRAAAYLGLDREQARQLFIPQGNGYYDATFDQGIKVLEHLRDTGEVDWTASGLSYYTAEELAAQEEEDNEEDYD